MADSGIIGVFGGFSARKTFHVTQGMSIFLFVALWFVAGAAQAQVADFKTYDMMGFTWMPDQHSDKGLEKVLVLYECAMFYPEYVHGVNNCADDNDSSDPNEAVIRQRAMETYIFSVPVVAIDIEGGVWDLTSPDLDVVAGAVQRWQELIAIWREVNPVTKILIYGGMPRVAWALQTSDQGLLQLHEQQARIIAPLFENENVELWPSAYVHYDSPDIFRAERKWQIDTCHRVYQTKCYFAIMPQYTDYFDSGTGNVLYMDRNSFLDIMKTLKEDGADGFGLWIDPRGFTDDYVYRRQVWSWAGGATGAQRDRDLTWMSALEIFLDANIAPPAEQDADYCLDSIMLAAASSCPVKVSRRLEGWNWLKKFARENISNLQLN